MNLKDIERNSNEQVQSWCPLCGEKINKFSFCNVCYASALQEAMGRNQGRSVSIVLKERLEKKAVKNE